MEDIVEALAEIGYEGLDADGLQKAIVDGPKSITYTKLVEWITKELQVLYCLEEHVNGITTPDDSSSFLLELSSFLKEIGCCYTFLTEGRVNERLQSEHNKILLLDYLLTELKSARMIQANKPDDSLRIKLNESPTAIDLKKMLIAMKFPKPPANIPPKVLFSKVEQKLKEIVSKTPKALYAEPLFTGKLKEEHCDALEKFYKELYDEYKIRREMLLKRLDVTIQSFEWSDRLKSKSNEIRESFQSIRNSISSEPNVKLSDILAARKDLAVLEKTSSASVRRKTQCEVNKVMIGMVPDRGGRPYEQEPPPPEMPSWQQRSNTGGSRGGASARGGREGGGRNANFNSGGNQGKNFSDFSSGSRVQAGWNAPSNFSNKYENTGYDQSNRGGNYSRQGGFSNQTSYGNNDGGYHQQQGNHQNYDNRLPNRGGFNNYNRDNHNRGRGGGYQNSDYNRNEGSRNYYNRR